MSKDYPEFRVYLSSTADDLQEERAAAINVVRKYAIVKDSYRASEDRTVNNCIADVRECNLYIGIIGHRYGWIPPDNDESDPNAKSITELEYDACVQPGRPPIGRLIFIRTTSRDADRDSEKRVNTSERIRNFRNRAGCGADQQAFQFDTIAQFSQELLRAIIEKLRIFHEEYEKKQLSLSSASGLMAGRKDWEHKLGPICLINPSISDELNKIAPHCGKHFSIQSIHPNDDSYLSILEKSIQISQLTCLVITRSSLLHFLAQPQKMTQALQMLLRRYQRAVLLLVDVDKTKLHPDWQCAEWESFDRQTFDINPDVAVETLFQRLRGNTVDDSSICLALPWLVIAPIQEEINELIEQPDKFLTLFDEEVKAKRKEQLSNLIKNAKKSTTGWPQNIYGDSREDWHCCGNQTIKEVVESVIKDINNSPPRFRERQLLRDAKLVSRPYNLNEYLENTYGSKVIITNIIDSGVLVIVDELALLHPKLRTAAIDILGSPNVAAISINPCDPTSLSTSKLLSEVSHLRVGNLITRFEKEYDPQCEFASNSEARIRRWLRHAIPRLITDMDKSSSRPLLVDQTDALFY